MNREPVVAGRFYPGSKEQCLETVKECLDKEKFTKDITSRVMGGIVPHAGWVYSGSTAGLVFQAIKQTSSPSIFVLFGAVHVHGVSSPSIWRDGIWETPLGDISVNQEVTHKILERSKGLIIENTSPHEREHSIEVQVPFIQYFFPEATIVPIMVPPDKNALKTGEIVGHVMAEYNNSVVIGSTDLTHYGYNYGHLSHGTGKAALDWVKGVNDKKLVELVVAMKAEEIIPEASNNGSACGAGAIAATISALRVMGASKGDLLKYTTSYDEIPSGEPSSFVGYSGVIFY